jgi:hypothetical protein
MRRRWRAGPRSATLLAWLLLAAPWAAARADEGGTAFWLSGQYASLAAVPPSPGWSLGTTVSYASGSASASTALPLGPRLAFGVDSRSLTLSLQPTFVPDATVLGGRLSLGLGFGAGRDFARQDLAISAAGQESQLDDTVWGASDLAPLASLSWGHGVHNWLAYVTGNIPVGTYDRSRLANVGIGHWAIDAGGGYTYLDAATGLEFSAVVGFTYNFENPSTRYQSGIDSHLDWGASLLLPRGWQVGLAGYGYLQLTGDRGSGAQLGGFKSKVAGVGPQLGYQFDVGGQQWSASLRAYWEPWAENRVRGYAVFAALSIPLSGYGR